MIGRVGYYMVFDLMVWNDFVGDRFEGMFVLWVISILKLEVCRIVFVFCWVRMFCVILLLVFLWVFLWS